MNNLFFVKFANLINGLNNSRLFFQNLIFEKCDSIGKKSFMTN